ncbi:Gfo/Idh/MocA family oxidoreductase [Occultella gossypii]|uniref:Gfo/Idh/MocA family oxidoreductase n=1 Tax=Occultella gossypii TaxID=2800820 RepID=A0ABS7SJN3_9MICO|nr:Gfo/Idh/MocA family oxidoreductase [Occultella gossypii]MBZ2199556.1 Gfo/Idh/MocA family oxidoreductase [Occultella gossypii]
MKRIGFIGTENSHTDHFIRFLNAEERHPGHRAAALVGGANDRNSALAASGGIDLVVEAPEDLIGQVDAAIISSRDGALHRRQAEPLLAAGIPVLVDKPLATTVPDAAAILAAAHAGGAPVFSGSALRFVPQISELRDGGAELGPLRHLHVVGPADPDSPYSGLAFYGIHHVEAALEILGNPVLVPGEVTPVVRRHGDTTTAVVRLGETEVTFTFVVPGDATRVPFHATAVRTNGVMARELVLDRDYNAPALAAFIDAVETGRSPVTDEHLLSPVVVLSAIAEALPLGKDES